METKIYISGPITGLPYEEARAAFMNAENAIRSRYSALVEIVNPIRLVPKNTSWNDAMRTCIAAMMDCNYIHTLPGFEQSEGARLEYTIALKLGFGVCDNQLNLVAYGKQQ